MPKLLLAVESPTIRRVLELTFAGGDIDVVAVDNGEQAIARIPVERPDLVLVDIALPQRSGYDVAAFVKNDAALAQIRVLLLAGAFEPVDEARAAKAKADGVLAKPFESQHVVTRVRQLLSLATGLAVDRAPEEYSEQLDDDLPIPTMARLMGDDNGAAGNLSVTRAEAARGTFDLLSAGDPPITSRARSHEVPKPGTIADAFAALLAFEKGDRTVPPVRLVAQSPQLVGEDMIEEITRRVLARLAPGTVKDVVTDVVSEVAERLVRQEIERTRKNS